MSPINIPIVKLYFLRAKCILCVLFLAFSVEVVVIADERTQTIQSIILDSFDDENNITISQEVVRTWEIVGSTFRSEGYPIKKYLQVAPEDSPPSCLTSPRFPSLSLPAVVAARTAGDASATDTSSWQHAVFFSRIIEIWPRFQLL